MAKKILVTGGCGYLGSILVPELLEKGLEVTVVDNMMYGEPSLAHACHHRKFEFVLGDVRCNQTMKKLLRHSDIIIPLAAYVGAPLCMRDPVGASSTNKEAILNMFKALSKDQLVLMPTTNSAYGSGDEHNYCDETSPLKPISKYAVDKVEIEKELMQRERSVSFRLATVFGMSPRMRLDLLVNDFTYRALTDKFIVLFESHFKRNYIHIRDISRVFLHAIKNTDNLAGNIYNVGLSDANVSKRELCDAIAKEVQGFYYHEAAVGQDPDQRNYVVSNAKIEATGFLPKVSLNDGIRELVKGLMMLNNKKFGNA